MCNLLVVLKNMWVRFWGYEVKIFYFLTQFIIFAQKFNEATDTLYHILDLNYMGKLIF